LIGTEEQVLARVQEGVQFKRVFALGPEYEVVVKLAPRRRDTKARQGEQAAGARKRGRGGK